MKLTSMCGHSDSGIRALTAPVQALCSAVLCSVSGLGEDEWSGGERTRRVQHVCLYFEQHELFSQVFFDAWLAAELSAWGYSVSASSAIERPNRARGEREERERR